MIVLLAVAGVALAVVVGVTAGWRWVFAPLLGYALLTWLIASLRALTRPLHADDETATDPIGENERVLFWCQECGTELLLLVRGTARAPSHCGQRMHERTEIIG